MEYMTLNDHLLMLLHLRANSTELTREAKDIKAKLTKVKALEDTHKQQIMKLLQDKSLLSAETKTDTSTIKVSLTTKKTKPNYTRKVKAISDALTALDIMDKDFLQIVDNTAKLKKVLDDDSSKLHLQIQYIKHPPRD